MKICIVLDSLHFGGSEILSVRLAEGFIKAGHSVFIIALSDEGRVVNTLKESNISYQALHSQKGVRLSIMLKLYQLIRQCGCDLVITNHFRCLFHTVLPALVSRTPQYHVEHDNTLYKKSARHLRALKYISFCLQKMIVISKTLHNYFDSAWGRSSDKIVTIENGVDTTVFFPDKKSQKNLLQQYFPGEEHIIFGTSARLEPVKNIGLMLEIFSEFRKRTGQGVLLIVGDGSCRKELEEKVERLAISGHVVFAGFQDNVSDWYKAMDFYLVTSDDEGLPLAVLEAMACGVPVITRDVGDLPRLIDSEVGRIVAGTDREKWADSLCALKKDSPLYEKLSQSARNRVEESYSMQVCIDSYLALLVTHSGKSVIKNKKM